ncbi:MAG: hypothetical protein HGB14_10210, partial [Anaerolineaceae bacterium]|nr:hypothetical protein [Anaerolineaceae bacterium]
MERIVTKDPKTQEEPEKMLLLAELLALNFDEHFQFKPMLADLQKKLSQSQKLPELESIGSRIVDRQTDILRSAMRTQGDEYQQDHEKIQDIFISDLFFEKHSKDDKERQKDIPIS